MLDALNYLHIPNTNTISNSNTIIIIINNIDNSTITIITWQSYMGNIYLVLIVIIIIVTITIIPIIIIVLMKRAIVDHR